MRPLSLKWRVSLLVSLILVAVITTISAVAYVEFKESHLRDIDRILLAMANGILAELDSPQADDATLAAIGEVTGRSARDSSMLYRVWTDDSSVDRFASDGPDTEHGRWLRELEEPQALASSKYVFCDIGRPGDEYRAIWLHHETTEGMANVVVAGPSRFTFHELREFLKLLLILGASLIAGSALAITWTARQALLPIGTTAQRLQRISNTAGQEAAFDDLRAPQELHPFIEAVRNMLGRLDNIMRRQRQFSSDAAHELRTPLAAAKSTLQAAQMRPREAGEYREAISEALGDIARMQRLIDQLLVLARLDEAAACAVMGEVRLDEMLGDLAEASNEKARGMGGRVIVAEAPATSVAGDTDTLVRAFANVIDNATKYGPPGGTVRIGLNCESDGWVSVCVHDDGGNIPPEALPHLGDRFYRVDASRSNSTGGTGLGLAIAREIVHRHGGNLSITSEPGSGTTVCIRLPRA